MDADWEYLQALKTVGRLADELLDARTADKVLALIGVELDRLGLSVGRREGRAETVH